MKGFPHRITRSLPFRCFGCVMLFAVTTLLHQRGFFQPLEYAAYDFRAHVVAMLSQPSDDVIVISIDNACAQMLEERHGHFPWPGNAFLPILEYCDQAKVVGFDLAFAEQTETATEQPIIDLIRKNGNVVSSMVLYDTRYGEKISPKIHAFALRAELSDLGEITPYWRANIPSAQLLDVSRRVGHVNFTTDSDGAIRRFPLVTKLQDRIYPSLALATTIEFLDFKGNDILWDFKSRLLTVGDCAVEGLADGTYYYKSNRLHKTGKPYATFRCGDILAARQLEIEGGEAPAGISRESFKNKLVLIGLAADRNPGEQVKTSTSRKIPGVYVMATVCDNLLRSEYYTQLPEWVDLCLIAFFALLPAFFFSDKPGFLLTISLLVGAAYLLVSLVLAMYFHQMILTAAPLMGLLSSLLVLGSLHWVVERLRRHDLEMLETYKQQFTDMLVHDLKGGISSIVMSIGMIADPEHLSAMRREKLLGTIRSSGERLLTQVNALLDIRKIEEGRLPLDFRDINMLGLLQDAAKEYHASASVVGLSVQGDFMPEEEAVVSLDPDIFRRIMGNLLWNAIQYARKKSEILIRAVAFDDRIEIHVCNEGKIIPPASQASLFSAFAHHEHSGKNVRSISTGLGLAFCKLAMEAHGGKIELLSPWPEKEEGVQIILTFLREPVRPDPPQAET